MATLVLLACTVSAMKRIAHLSDLNKANYVVLAKVTKVKRTLQENGKPLRDYIQLERLSSIQGNISYSTLTFEIRRDIYSSPSLALSEGDRGVFFLNHVWKDGRVALEGRGSWALFHEDIVYK